MPQTRKIATCCYCGIRAVLVLDQARHELTCSACGAPLHQLKLMPVPQAVRQKSQKFVPGRQKTKVFQRPRPKKYERQEKRSKRKPLSRKIFEEVWDVVEDIFD